MKKIYRSSFFLKIAFPKSKQNILDCNTVPVELSNHSSVWVQRTNHHSWKPTVCCASAPLAISFCHDVSGKLDVCHPLCSAQPLLLSRSTYLHRCFRDRLAARHPELACTIPGQIRRRDCTERYFALWTTGSDMIHWSAEVLSKGEIPGTFICLGFVP